MTEEHDWRVGSRIAIFAMAAVIVMISSSMASLANTQWEGVMPQDNTMNLYDEVLSTSAVDPTGNVKVGFAAMLDSANTVDGGNSYHEITIGTTLFADTYSRTGYSVEQIVSSAQGVPLTSTPLTLGEDEGIMIKLPTYLSQDSYFRYFGKSHDRVFVCANGFLIFGGPDIPIGARSTDTTYTNPIGTISSNELPNGVVAPYWKDMKGSVTVRYGLLVGTNILVIWWDHATTVGGNVQTFGVVLWLTNSPDNPVYPPEIHFFYTQITLEYSYDRKSKSYYPTFEIGVQNQFGTKYTSLYSRLGEIGPKNQVSTNKIVHLTPLPGNLYDIDRVNVYIVKVKGDTTSTSHDEFASVHVTGQADEIWGGSNIVSVSNVPPVNPYADYKNQILANYIWTVAGSIPIAGAIIGATGCVVDSYQLCLSYKAAERGLQTVADDAEYTEDSGQAGNVAKDGASGVAGQASDVWSAPMFKWRLLSSDLTALYSYSHYLTVQAQVIFEDNYNNEQTPLFTEALTFKFDHNKLEAFKDDFNSGILSNWVLSRTGTNGKTNIQTGLSATGVMKETFSDYSLSDWTVDASGGTVGFDKLLYGTPSGRPDMKISKTSTQGGASAYRTFNHQSSHFVARLWLSSPTTCSGGHAIYSLSQGSVDRIWIEFNAGWIKYKDNTGVLKSLTQFAVNTWYQVTLRVWPTNGNYSVEVNGAFVPSVVMLGSPPWNNNWIDKIGFKADTKAISLSVDDIWIGGDEYLYLYYPDSANKMRLTSPSIQIDRTIDYTIQMNYFGDYVWGSSYVVVFDDSGVEIVNKVNSATGKSALYANTANGLVLIKDLAGSSVWHRIVIKVHPNNANYIVLLDDVWGDDGGLGPYSMKPMYSTPGYTFSLGSKVTPVQGESGGGAWDDIVIAGAYPRIYTLHLQGSHTTPPSGYYQYLEGTVVSVSTISGHQIGDWWYQFDYWELDGIVYSYSRSVQVTMNANHLLDPVYYRVWNPP